MSGAAGDRRRRVQPPSGPAGYSGTPLAKKLGITAGFTFLCIDAPTEYRSLLQPDRRQRSKRLLHDDPVLRQPKRMRPHKMSARNT